MTGSEEGTNSRERSGSDLWKVVVVAAVVFALYLPLLSWLLRATLSLDQLGAGALLLLFALAGELRSARREFRVAPRIRDEGLLLLLLGLACLWLAGQGRRLALPLALLSFSFSFMGLASFLFGREGARRFVPVVSAFVVFGLLAGLFPALDWPLRGISARWSAGLLNLLEVPVRLALAPGRPPELVLAVRGRFFLVAAECNGFGLLTSSLLLATLLAFREKRRWPDRVALLVGSALTAIAFNILRIVAISLAATQTALPYPLIHEGLGTIAILLGLGAVLFLASPGKDGRAPRGGNPLARSFARVARFRLARFVSVGGCAALTDLALFWILNQGFGWPRLAAQALSRPAGGIVSFVLNKLWTFKNRDPRSARRQALRFVAIWAGMFLGSSLLMEGWRALLPAGFPRADVVAKLLAEATLGLLSFLLQRHWVFRKRPVEE